MSARPRRPITAEALRPARGAVVAAKVFLAFASTVAVRAQIAVEPVAEPVPQSRIIHRFDFLEPHYYGTVPRGWDRFPPRDIPDSAFPRYAEGRFDHDVGHSAPPSFYLETDGRSVAYRYTGAEAHIRPGDYVVGGWIRSDHLRTARAALSAYYLDWEGRFIPGTQRFSRLVGGEADVGESDEGDWQQVSVRLSNAPTSAHMVGITCWVVQQDVWRGSTVEHRHLALRDVAGGAWFDDIIVQGHPRAQLTVAHPGAVIESPDPVVFSIVVADEETDGLAAEFMVHDRDGVQVDARSIPVHTFERVATDEVVLPGLRPGLYRAKLVVRSLGEVILERFADFAVLGERHATNAQIARRLGVILPQAPVDSVENTLALIALTRVGVVKLPIWTGDPAVLAFDADPQGLHDVLDRLIASRVDVVGVLGGAPTNMTDSAGTFAPSLLDILSRDPRGWRGPLDTVVAPYASIFQAWQLGCDDDREFAGDPRQVHALVALREAMRELLPSPNLAVATSAGEWPGDTTLPAETLSVALPRDVHSDRIAEHLAPFVKLKYNHLWLTVPRGDDTHLAPDAALNAWARGLIEARCTPASRVFTEAPWRVRDTSDGPVSEPTAAYLVLRTIADLLGDGEFVASVPLADGATLRAFGDGHTAAIVAWDEFAPEGGTWESIQLGAADHYVDIWGERHPLRRTRDGRHKLPLGKGPVFVPDVEQWLVAFRAGIQFTPSRVPLAIEPQAHLLHLSNPRDAALSGEIEFQVREPWEVDPSRVRFALQPGEERSFPLLVRQPQDESAGPKVIHAAVQFQSDPKYRLDIPLRFDLGLADVDVWGYAVNEGDSVRVRHGVTNRAAVPLSFRAFAVLPGRSRQYRTINELLPGQTLTTEYLFRHTSGVSGRFVRLGLREVNGPRLHNLEVQVP